jgi:hypothetical protein
MLYLNCHHNDATGTEYKEEQQSLSGVHSIMRVKLAQAGEGGVARLSPFTTFTITSEVAVSFPRFGSGRYRTGRQE